MYRPAIRAASAVTTPLRVAPRANAARRLLSTAPPHQKSRSWKSSAARWTLAGALIYYYNTSTVFAEEPAYIHDSPDASRDTEPYPTVSSVAEQRRTQLRQTSSSQSQKQTEAQAVAVAPGEDAPPPGSPEALEEEADQQGAFNEETGEINWDCPCLGGMAYGPCGEQFRNAFSCFIYSKEEPKGIECIENFKAMQNCFREHPDIYGSELEDDEATEGQSEAQDEPVTPQAQAPSASAASVSAEQAPAELPSGDSAAPVQVNSNQKLD